MNISLAELCDKIACSLGELPERRLLSAATDRGLPLEEAVAPVVEGLAAEVTLAAPFEDIDTLYDFRELVEATADWGDEDYMECELPDNMLALRLFRLLGWQKSVERATVPGEGAAGLRAALGGSAPSWMRAQVARPVVELLPCSDGNGRRLRAYPPGSGGVTDALYIPRPRIYGDKLLDISSRLVDPLALRCADFLASSGG